MGLDTPAGTVLSSRTVAAAFPENSLPAANAVFTPAAAVVQKYVDFVSIYYQNPHFKHADNITYLWPRNGGTDVAKTDMQTGPR
jgi:hypothetical protein